LLRGEELADARRLPGCFRSHVPDSWEAIPARDARTIALAAELGEVGAFLQGLLAEPTLCLDELRSRVPMAERDHAWRQGYELGARARSGLEALDPTIPASRPLRSVQQTLERLGLHVAFVSLDAWSRQAVSVFRPGAMPVVLLNAAHERTRRPLSRRAVLAHELEHLLHDTGEIDLSPTERQPSPRLEAVEQRANGFAPAFLAPPAFVRKRVDRSATAEQIALQIAREWGFTLEGAVWHAKNVELVSGDDADALIADVAWRSGRSRIPGAWEPEVARDDPRDHGLDVDVSPLVGGLVQDLVLRAYRLGEISSGRAREILAVG
jgi:Zn-dependent peptidase ImmA (M78 family)